MGTEKKRACQNAICTLRVLDKTRKNQRKHQKTMVFFGFLLFSLVLFRLTVSSAGRVSLRAALPGWDPLELPALRASPSSACSYP